MLCLNSVITGRASPIAVALCTGLLLSVSTPALAACNGTIASPSSAAVTTLCNNDGIPTTGNLTVNDNVTFKDTTTTSTAGNNTLIQFDGHGRVLNNSGSIINDRVITGTTGARGRTAVTMGASTVNAGNTTSYAAPAYNAQTNTTTIPLNGGTPAANWVGQTITFGRYDAADADFFPATSYIITAVNGQTVTVAGALPAGYSGAGTLPERYSVVSNFGVTTTVNGVAYNNVINNSGTISTSIKAAEVSGNKVTPNGVSTSVSNTANVRAINTSVAGDYLVQNSGTIRATHEGLGQAYGVFQGGLVTNMTINNSGLIEAIRTAPITLASVSATANPTATSTDYAGFSAATLGNVYAIATEEEGETTTITNAQSGVIRSRGDYSGAIYLRGEESTVVNNGTIEQLSSAGTVGKGFAIGAVSNGGGIRELELQNNGIIRGDILGVNGAALRWYMLSTENGGAAANDRLTINSQFGQQNTEIENKGTILGNIWLSNGAHEIENEKGGTIVGNIDVDQRNTTSGTASGTVVTVLAGSDENPGASNNTLQGAGYVIRGDKTFEFENEGAFRGNLKITNASSAIVNGTFNGSTINKIVSSDNQIVNSGSFDGNISIFDLAGAKNQITLQGDGFGRRSDGSINTATGNISASTGAGDNTLNLEGAGTLRGNVDKLSTLNVKAGALSVPDDDDDDDDDDEAGGVAGNVWTLAGGKSFQFQTVNINEGVLNVMGHLFGQTNVKAGTVLTGEGLLTGNVTANGTIDVAEGTLSVAGNVAFKSGSLLATTIGESGNGLFNVTGINVFEAGSGVSAEIDGARVRDGDTYKIVSTTGGVVGVPAVEDSSALLSWTPTVQGNDLFITADVDIGKIDGLGQPATAALTALLDADNELGNQVLMIQDADGVRKAAKQLAPETNFATQQAALTLAFLTGQSIETRLANVGATAPSASNYAPPSGLGMGENKSNLAASTDEASDDVPSGDHRGLWGQAFGSGLSQDSRESVDGYDAKIYGLLTGIDTKVAPGLRVGGAGGYARTQVDGIGDTALNSTNIDSYLATLYGAWRGPNWFVTGRAGYTWHDYETSRVLTGPVRRNATGSHDGDQYTAAVEAGLPIKLSHSTLTPVASLTYNRLSQDGYNETSSGGMGLSIDDQSTTSLVSGLGLKAVFQIAPDTAIEGRALWLHEFDDTEQQVTASIAGGSPFVASGPSVGRDTADLGAGMVAFIGSGTSFQINYDALLREDFIAHAGSGKLRIEY